MFEATELFTHTLGSDSEVMAKETYTFEDSGGKTLTLRPEGTAAIARAWSNLANPPPLFRASYKGAMFRRERPQRGRLRQFHQVGVEVLGVSEAWGDGEAIALAAEFLGKLNLTEKPTLRLNTIGDTQSRANWVKALSQYFTKHQADLSEPSKQRIATNPLRILDSKDPQDQTVAENAPKFSGYISKQAEEFFAQVCRHLKAAKVEWVGDERLVRGLDYYCHTAFEFSVAELGRQGTVLAGGRYDGLVKTIGGGNVAGIGWAAGVERLAELLEPPPAEPLWVFIGVKGEVAGNYSLINQLLAQLRASQAVEYIEAPLAKGLKFAHNRKAEFAFFVGKEELAQRQLTLKNLTSGSQATVSFAKLGDGLKATLRATKGTKATKDTATKQQGNS